MLLIYTIIGIIFEYTLQQ